MQNNLDKLDIKELSSLQEWENSFSLVKSLKPDLELDYHLNNYQRLKDSGYHIIIAINEEKIIGFAGYRILEHLGPNKFLWIYDLVVDQAWRNNNIGKKLIERLNQIAKKDSCKKIRVHTTLSNEGAQRFYSNNNLKQSCFVYEGKI